MQASIDYSRPTQYDEIKVSTEDYGTILESLEVPFTSIDYFFQIGDIKKTQGWILHLSVVLSQIRVLLQQVIPILVKRQVPFKMVMSESAGDELLNGYFGTAQIGKIVSIYPETDFEAIQLAKDLIDMTRAFKGPSIPTDICLGNIVYTRYGSFNPIIEKLPNGLEVKYIYDIAGQLTIDSYSMPFEMPKGIEWPFKEISDPPPPAACKLSKGVYKILEPLKIDPRGNVFKGLYVKGLFQVKNCVIKQGFSNSASDKFGRDIKDRLLWQYKLYEALSATVPMPTIYDLINETDFSLLIMQYINGDSLYQTAQNINPLSKSVQCLNTELISLIDYGIEITTIIGKLHQKGYLHRDIVPVNFLIDKDNRIFLIDMELAYCIRLNIPNPPFALGTSGFMSPEQEAQREPSVAQDIYSLAATLLYLFSGLTPIKFDTQNSEILYENLVLLIGNKEMASVLANSLSHEPTLRPTIPTILGHLSKYKRAALHSNRLTKSQSPITLDIELLERTISSAIKGLASSSIISTDDLWLSKRITTENYSTIKNIQFERYPGLGDGIAGPLYLLARMHNFGVSIDNCKCRFIKAWKFLDQNYFSSANELQPGLNKGAAGWAITLAEVVKSGLVQTSQANLDNVQHWLQLPNEKFDLFNGVAGQGVAVLQCAGLLARDVSQQMLDKFANHLLMAWKKQGNWTLSPQNKFISNNPLFDFGHDDTGIMWFLLDYLSHSPNNETRKTVIDSLKSITGNKKYMRQFDNLTASRESYELNDGGRGLILLLLKAYEVLQDHSYRKLAENSLLKYPPQVVHTNYSQRNGLAGLGEIYLEAWRILKAEEWKIRADWIANLLAHTIFHNGDGSGYWKLEENSPPTASLLSGTSGIIHFLARCLDPTKIGYRMLA